MRISNSSSRLHGTVAAICFKAIRQLHLARLTLACMVVAGLGCVFTASADVPNCDKLIKPNATRTLGPGIASVESTSNGASYAGGGIQPANSPTKKCLYWVVDIVVPSNSSGSNSASSLISLSVNGPNSSVFGPDTQAACESYKDYLLVYAKSSKATKFGSTVVEHRERIGVWNKEKEEIKFRCVLQTQPSSKTQSHKPPTAGTDTYRVAAAAKIGDNWQQVQVTGGHSSAPK